MSARKMTMTCPFRQTKCDANCALLIESSDGYYMLPNGKLANGSYMCGLAILAIKAGSDDSLMISNTN